MRQNKYFVVFIWQLWSDVFVVVKPIKRRRNSGINYNLWSWQSIETRPVGIMFINLITVRQPLIYDCERTGSGSNSAETVVVCPIIIYSVGLLMMYGAMHNTPPPPKNIKILFNWRTFMDCIEYVHSLKKTLWMMKKEFRSYLKLNRSGFCRFSVCLLLINKAILEHLPNRLHWCTLKSKPRLS